MSEPGPWASPSGTPGGQDPAPFTPPSASPVPPPVPPGQPGWTPAAQGWTPPPKPGLIPLHPLTLGPLLGASFQVMRRNPKPTFGMSLLLSGLVTIASLLIMGVVVVFAFQRLANAAPEDADQIASGTLAIGFIATLIPIGVGIGAFAILQGVISLEVARGTVGEKLKLRGLVRMARGRILPLVGWALILLAAILIAILVVVLITVLLGVAFGVQGALAGALFGVLLSLGLTALGVWLAVKTSLVPSVLMMERLSLRDAIVRSWRLTGGYFWRTFGIQLLVIVIVNTATQVVTTPFALIGSLLITLVNPLDDPAAFAVGFGIFYLVLLLVSLVISAIALIVQSSATALIYIDLRMRKEGLDVELQRFVEARQAGDAAVPDPYLPRTGQFVPPVGSPWS